MFNENTEETNNSEDCEDVPTHSTMPKKEKRNWFNFLTIRKKSQSHPSLSTAAGTTVNSLGEPLAPQPQRNNIATSMINTVNTDNAVEVIEDPIEAGTSKNINKKKNMFQRIRNKIGTRYQSFRSRNGSINDDLDAGGGTTDASSEFLTHSPIREPQLKFSFTSEMTPFSNDYERFIVKKWMHCPIPNEVMFRASLEMLSQVWYWGEIARRDAQKKLTDKPTGSFLVRDSETSGSQFTLSFRIRNVTLHYRLENRDGYWLFEEMQYESIVEMIEDILHRCTNDNIVCYVKVPTELQPPIPVILKFPLSRYSNMPQLQDLCRRVIQKHMTMEEISNLPIPRQLSEYLSVPRGLVFQG